MEPMANATVAEIMFNPDTAPYASLYMPSLETAAGSLNVATSRRLRPRHHGPRRRAPEPRQELPPPHPSSPKPRRRQSIVDKVEGERGPQAHQAAGAKAPSPAVVYRGFPRIKKADRGSMPDRPFHAATRRSALSD